MHQFCVCHTGAAIPANWGNRAGAALLTLFTTPKPFLGHIAIIQGNALTSWTKLVPRPDILLFGDAKGTSEAAADLGLRHIPEVATSEFGTPLVNDMFARAEAAGQHDLLCYVNADIILTHDFSQAAARLAVDPPRFLMVGQRWDVDITQPLNFEMGWEDRIKERARHKGRLHEPTGIDYFVYRRGQWGSLPAFAVGRIGYDNWLLYEARRTGSALIDATGVVMAIHQNHDFAHLPNGDAGIKAGPEARRNMALVGDILNVFTIVDANWRLTPRGLAPVLSRAHLQQQLWRWYKRRTTLRAGLRWVRRLVMPS
jgi:hypothetical protein